MPKGTLCTHRSLPVVKIWARKFQACYHTYRLPIYSQNSGVRIRKVRWEILTKVWIKNNAQSAAAEHEAGERPPYLRWNLQYPWDIEHYPVYIKKFRVHEDRYYEG